MTDDTIVVVEPPSNMTVLVTGVETVVVTQVAVAPTIIETGAGGGSGPAVDPTVFFQVALLLSELDTEPKKATARTNLGLATIDGGTF